VTWQEAYEWEQQNKELLARYTTAVVTQRLWDAGFKVDGDIVGPGGGYNRWAYRSDTLLAWLMKQDAGKVAEVMGVRTLCENGRYGYVQIDVLDNGDWNVSLFRPIEVRVTAPNLPDALAEVVMKVLEASE